MLAKRENLNRVFHKNRCAPIIWAICSCLYLQSSVNLWFLAMYNKLSSARTSEKKTANICSNDNRNTEKYFQNSLKKKRRECAIKLLDCSWGREILNWINAYWLISIDDKRKLWWLWDSPKFIDCLWKQVCHDGLLRVHRMDITLEFQLENEFLK